MTIDQVKNYMNLSPQIALICSSILQSKEQEKLFLEINALRLLEKERILSNMTFLIQKLLPGNILYVHNLKEESPVSFFLEVTEIPLPDPKSGKVQIEGYPIVTDPLYGQKLADILHAQPL